jgi:hypothetical protein
MLAWLRDKGARYGAAWMLTIHALSLTMFWSLFALFAFSPPARAALRSLAESDLLRRGALAPLFNATLTAHVALPEAASPADFAGAFALAFVANRLLAPLRIGLALLLVPRVASRLNPLWARCRQRCRRQRRASLGGESVPVGDVRAKAD